MILIYTTCASRAEAQKIARKLLEEHLIVCANYWPISSLYLWNNKIESGKEFSLLLKSQSKNFKKIEKVIKKMHSYKMPCIFSWETNKIEKNYSRWVCETLS